MVHTVYLYVLKKECVCIKKRSTAVVSNVRYVLFFLLVPLLVCLCHYTSIVVVVFLIKEITRIVESSIVVNMRWFCSGMTI